jgi:hypothetical protein
MAIQDPIGYWEEIGRNSGGLWAGKRDDGN